MRGRGNYTPWTPADERTLRTMISQRERINTIAKRLGVPAQRVRDKIKDLSIRADGDERKCLCCGQSFISEGPHNRMCGACKRMA